MPSCPTFAGETLRSLAYMQTARLEDFIRRQFRRAFTIAHTFLNVVGAYWLLACCWPAQRLIVFGIDGRPTERWHSSCSLSRSKISVGADLCVSPEWDQISLSSFHLLHVISLQFTVDFGRFCTTCDTFFRRELCREVRKQSTRENRSARLRASKKATKSAASPERKLSAAPGRRSIK
jgi:hypothetical protein